MSLLGLSLPNGPRTAALAILAAALLSNPAGAAPQPQLGAVPATSSASVNGQVTDLATGLPIAGAEIRSAGQSVRSGADGRFQLDFPPGTYPLRISAPGYGSATVVDVARHQAIAAAATRPVPFLPDPAAPIRVALPPLAAGELAAQAMAARLKASLAVEDENLRRRITQSAGPGTRPEAALAETAAPAPVTEVPRQIRVQLPDGQIVAMDTDEYLKGVVPAEMGYIFRRAAEALKAQAIASRTYAATGCLAASAGDPAVCEPGLDANVDTTTRTQVWRPVHYDLTDAAVEATHGQALRQGDTLVRALFFAHAVTRTLDSEASGCCGGTKNAYLRGVASPDPFAERFGHGAGLSQEGAAVLAAWGATAEEIVQHYYTGVHVEPTAAPRVFDALVTPREAYDTETITFQASYADADGDPPVEALVLIDGTPRPLIFAAGSNPDYRSGVSYSLTTTLAIGSHAVTFRFSDGHALPVEVDAGTVEVKPLPAGAAIRPAAASSAIDALPGTPPESGLLQGEASFAPGELQAVAPEGRPAGASPSTGGRLGSSPTRIPLRLPQIRPEADELNAIQPETTAVGGLVQTPVATSTFGFMALGVEWSGALPSGAHLLVWLRTSRDGRTWSAWLPAGTDAADAKVAPAAAVWSGLVIARGRYAQARLAMWNPSVAPSPASASVEDARRPVRLHFFNTDAGPFASGAYAAAVAEKARARPAPDESLAEGSPSESPSDADAAAAADPTIIPRSGWGANEQLRFNASGQEIWPPEYTTPRAQIVHHTVTINDPADPAAIVRSVYQYHAVAREWGDIGYNFLIDHRGRIYEGRYGGERNGQITQGGHALQFNANTIGIALLGTFTEAASQPSAAAEAALVELLASRGSRYRITPDQPVELAGTRFAYAVMGHRDALPGHTTCPGDGLFGRLATVRRAVAARMAEAGSPTATARPASTATRVPTARSSATAVPGGPTVAPSCANLVAGGDFEAETDRWIKNRSVYTRWDVFGGSQALFLGLTNADTDQGTTYASAEQVIRLPVRLGSAKLRFAARGVGDEGDRRLVRVLAGGGAVLATLSTAIPATSAWAVYEEDITRALTHYANQSVRLYFAVVNNGDGKKSYLRLDDVSLTVCSEPGAAGLPTGEAPPSATPGPPSVEPPPPTSPAAPTATSISAEATEPPTEMPTTAIPPTARPTAVPKTPTPAQTATRLPPLPPVILCREMIADGGFDGDTTSPWSPSGNLPALRADAPPDATDPAGQRVLRLGLSDSADDAFGYAASAQRFTLPRTVVSATLQLRYRLLRSGTDDAFVVEVRRLGDGLRQTLVGPRLAAPLDQWQTVRHNLEPAVLAAGAGQVHELYLAAFNRAVIDAPGDVTAAEVDDVSLEVCSTAGPRYFPLGER